MCCLFHCLNFFSHLQVWTCLHRDACWEWAIAPRVSPSPRYQHAAAGLFAWIYFILIDLLLSIKANRSSMLQFMPLQMQGSMYLYSGGALGGDCMVEDSSSVAVLDTAAGVCCETKSVVTGPRTSRYSADAAGGDTTVELTRCCSRCSGWLDIYLWCFMRWYEMSYYNNCCIRLPVFFCPFGLHGSNTIKSLYR